MLQVRLLGQFDIRVDGKRITIPSRAGQSLFAYLVLTAGTAHRREKLAGMFWPDTQDTIARTNLRRELWRIRKAISNQQPAAPEYLLPEEISIAFNTYADYWSDVAQLEREPSAEDDLSELISQVSLYRGELLPGFYDDWVMLERERIQAVYEARMQVLMERLVAAERWAAVTEWGEKWLSFGSTPEPAFRALMMAHAANGDMAQVAAIYQRCVNALRDELGVEPSKETQALYDGLAKGARVPKRAALVQASATVTFLFTDIEGSTRLLEALGAEYATMLDEHHELLRTAVKKWKGQEVDTQGDAFFVTFSRALDAVQCAAEVQRMFAAHPWPENLPVRVRMGLHTGEPLIASMGYVGMDVHRAARIGDAGHGGQVLLSQTTRELVMHDLPPGISIRDLGEHRLKDMKYPTSIYQLVIEGLPADFPPLKSRFTGEEEPTPGEPPFKGLQYFDEADADLFYGREVITAKLVDRLRTSQFMAVVVGASGSGKSSVVRAGLVPALKRGRTLADGTLPPEGSRDWQVFVLTPTAHPLEALAVSLTRNSDSLTNTARLMDDLARDPRSLYLYLRRLWADDHPPRAGNGSPLSPADRVILIVDQFEELFTLCHDQFEREQFIDNLLTTISPMSHGLISLIITLRADFYAHLAEYEQLRDAVARQQEYIGPMTTEELRRAIEEPAKRGGWEFEPGLVDLILRDVGDEPGALPLLSHALLETWKRRSGHTLTLKGYAAAGGVHGAIAQTAESAYQNLTSDEQALARNIFLRLTELGEGTEDTRRRATFEELVPRGHQVGQVHAVLTKLADARLITTGAGTAEVAHEALIREWPTLREWLNEDREGLRLHRQITEAAQEWALMERDPSALYRGSRLAQAREFAQVNPEALNDQERAFVVASEELEQSELKEKEEQQQRELEAAQKLAAEQQARTEEANRAAGQIRQRSYFLAGALALAVVLAAIALFLGDQARTSAANAQTRAQEAVAASTRAETERRIAVSRELSEAAINNLNQDPERSILLALQAVTTTYSVDKTWTVEADNALHRAVQASRVRLTLHGHKDSLESVAFSPDGTRLATAADDKQVKLWDASTGKELLTLAGFDDQVWQVAFSSDGKRFVGVGIDGTIKAWEVTTGKELLTLHEPRAGTTALSSDATRVATMNEDGTIRVWDTGSGEELVSLSGVPDNPLALSRDGTALAAGQDDSVQVWNVTTKRTILTLPASANAMAFSPDGKYIATGNVDTTATVWDLTSGAKVATLSGHSGLIYALTFSLDGSLLATAGLDGTAKVWDAPSGRLIMTLAGHKKALVGLAFSPDAKQLATASLDQTARIWDLSKQGGRELLVLEGHKERVEGVTYNPNGTRLASASVDGTARVWDAVTGKLLLTVSGHEGAIYDIAYSPDGKRLATAGEDGKARIWDAETGRELLTLSGHGPGTVGGLFKGVLAVKFSPDGTRIATAGADKTARIWDAATGREVLRLMGHEGGVTNVAFSPDGKLIATTGDDALVKIWDATAGRELYTLKGHEERVWGIDFSPDGKRLATSGFGGIVKIWDSTSGQEVMTLSGHVSTVGNVAYSRDGKLLATAGIDAVKVWDAGTGTELLAMTENSGGASAAALSPDGTRLVTGGMDSTLRVYTLRLEELVALARTRVTRGLTADECQKYLHMENCPPSP